MKKKTKKKLEKLQKELEELKEELRKSEELKKLFPPGFDDVWDQMKKINELNRVYEPQKFSDCMHDNCPACGGTGIRKDGLGQCIHNMSCPCKKCTPSYNSISA